MVFLSGGGNSTPAVSFSTHRSSWRFCLLAFLMHGISLAHQGSLEVLEGQSPWRTLFA
jgi:hypothetical protein